ncbi:MAG: coproporphyrinogen dehydrogenase HemZ, partial [Eubacteriales bacterium]|nr:coproporphyrinogen dehydrogenase HemZ [Eubacteriales bacterium]
PGSTYTGSAYPGSACPGNADEAEMVIDIDALSPEVKRNAVRFEEKTDLKRTLYKKLSEDTGRSLPWGTLTGIRPVRIVEMLEAEGMDKKAVRKTLLDRFLLSEEKAGLVMDIAKREKNVLAPFDFRNECSIYIGIPFCPTRCLYCSFASNPADRQNDRTDEYLDALIKEMKALAAGHKDNELAVFDSSRVRTIYVGGGTPTALSAAQLEKLLSEAEKCFGTGASEFTVEAGRPDSITREKLEVLKAHRVTRISINPQSFNQRTLDIIGRRHTVREVYEAYELARGLGFDNINMDLIMGLPGEGTEEVRHTLRCVRELGPESLTVHTLAVKKASRLSTEGKAWGGVERKAFDGNAADAKEMSMMTELGAECAASLGMAPYYLYRQKNMAGNQENVGYALPGRECLYNILMMEEKHTVYGLGAGSSTKIVYKSENAEDEFLKKSVFRIKRSDNVKNLNDYLLYNFTKSI